MTDRYDKKQKRKNQMQHTAMLVPVEVYNNTVHIGKGYILVREDGLNSVPVLTDYNDQDLPEGNYHIAACTMGQFLVVVPKRVQ